MVRIDQLPLPRGPAATPEGIADYMRYAERELARRAMTEVANRPPHELEGMTNVPLEGWWGNATPEDPRIAYERFIDASRIWVGETEKRDGRQFAYFGYDPGREMGADIWLKNFANLLRSAKYQKLMPRWWNPQHEIAMFRLGAKEDGGFFLLETRSVTETIEFWGTPTARIITGLAARMDTKVMKRSDEMSTAIGQVFLEAHGEPDTDFPEGVTREKGEFDGEGIPCRYGVNCKRRDCWFMHPRLEIPTGELERKLDDDISSKYIVDHCIEMAGDKMNLIKLIDYYQLSMNSPVDLRGGLIDPRNRNITFSKAETERFIANQANEGNPMAQYLWGKMLGDTGFDCLGKSTKQRKNARIKFLTSSAVAGNAYAHLDLGQMNADAGYLATAIQWYKRALSSAAIPEAAFYLGLSYGKEEYPNAGVPIQYKLSAKYYACALGPLLPDVNPFSVAARLDIDHNSIDYSLMYSVMTLGPGNDLQQTFQRRAMHNLDIIDRYLNNPASAPVPDTLTPPLPVDSTEICALCKRRPNRGERKLASCQRCNNAKYCNEICQRGAWTEGHKDECHA